jgi:hypothetical protein
MLATTQIASTEADSKVNYWAERREWWREEARRGGTDWASILETLRDVSICRASWSRRAA